MPHLMNRHMKTGIVVLALTQKESKNLTARPKVKSVASEEHSNQTVKFSHGVGLNTVACIPPSHDRSANSRLQLLVVQQLCRVQSTERVGEHYLHG